MPTVTFTWWQLLIYTIGICLSTEIMAVIKEHWRRCPRMTRLPLTGVEVRCFKRLDEGSCPDHGRIR